MWCGYRVVWNDAESGVWRVDEGSCIGDLLSYIADFTIWINS